MPQQWLPCGEISWWQCPVEWERSAGDGLDLNACIKPGAGVCWGR